MPKKKKEKEKNKEENEFCFPFQFYIYDISALILYSKLSPNLITTMMIS